MNKSHFDSVRTEVQHYRDRVMAEHKLAMDRFDCEAILRKGLFAFREVLAYDEALRLAVLEGKFEYDPTHDEAIQDAIRSWLEPCEHVLAAVERHEKSDFVVDQAGEFRKACCEAKGILTDDSKFFSGPKLESMEDAAIDAYRRGEAELF